jgi:hypothetical protein
MGHISPLMVLVPEATESCTNLIDFFRILEDERTGQELRNYAPLMATESKWSVSRNLKCIDILPDRKRIVSPTQTGFPGFPTVK